MDANFTCPSTMDYLDLPVDHYLVRYCYIIILFALLNILQKYSFVYLFSLVIELNLPVNCGDIKIYHVL